MCGEEDLLIELFGLLALLHFAQLNVVNLLYLKVMLKARQDYYIEIMNWSKLTETNLEWQWITTPFHLPSSGFRSWSWSWFWFWSWSLVTGLLMYDGSDGSDGCDDRSGTLVNQWLTIRLGTFYHQGKRSSLLIIDRRLSDRNRHSDSIIRQ